MKRDPKIEEYFEVIEASEKIREFKAKYDPTYANPDSLLLIVEDLFGKKEKAFVYHRCSKCGNEPRTCLTEKN